MPSQSKPIPKPKAKPGSLVRRAQARFGEALRLHQQGLLAQAKTAYEDVLKLDPGHFDSLHFLGVLAAQANQYQLAVDLIGKALEINPNAADAHYNRANALKELKQADAALACYDKAIALNPNHASAHYNRGNVLNELKQFDAAIVSYDYAIALKAEHAGAHYNRGNALREVNQFAAAVASYDSAISLNPGHAQAYSNRGAALKALNQLAAALSSYKTAIALDPDCADTYYNCGNALKGLKQLEDAIASYDKAIAINPEHANAYTNRGVALKELLQLEAAIASYDKAIAIKPDHAEAHYNRGNALIGLNRNDAAIASFNCAIAIKPDYADAYANRGIALKALNQLDDAVASYDKAIAIKPDAAAYYNRGIVLTGLQRPDAADASYDDAIALKPDYAAAYWNKSLALLLHGDFEQGWALYEWGFEHGKRGIKRNFTQALWLGAQSIKNKTVLLYSEQGLGDTLQFCRYARLLADQGARVILEANASLLPLLASLAGVSQLVATGSALPAFDFQCPLLSLPLAFKTSLATIPSCKAYLRVSDSKASKWATRLGTRTRPRVGLVWSGSTFHKNDHNRSLELSTLVPYLPQGLSYFSLQKEVRAIDQACLEAHPDIRHFGNELTDFADTAALCEQMDLVISVDTSVAHVSAAIGQTTWVLLPFSPDWRWLLNRDDSPWYPSVQLYRQAVVGDWTHVLQSVRAGLMTTLHQWQTSKIT